MFGRNARGFSFEIEYECIARNQTVDCNISYEGVNNATMKLSYERGAFEPNADLAGQGVSQGFPSKFIVA
jgi:hypothetical protein